MFYQIKKKAIYIVTGFYMNYYYFKIMFTT